MTPEQFRHVEALFHEVKELAPEAMELVLASCEDATVRNEIRRLVAHPRTPAKVLQAQGDAARLFDRIGPHLAAELGAGDCIGPYRILQVLGEGGMGVVYLAEQSSPVHRRVALKVIKLGMDTRETLARFESEREALALMNHANVARVIDAGATEQGRPYFVMEYVAGVPITEYCDEHRLTTRHRLQLFMDACQAVQHAHQKGLIHRDIKPSNVLVETIEGTPSLKVIDFGVAKATQQRLTERTFITENGQLIGTPGYMSPEQADMSKDVDTRSDIYSLGVLLYELLAGASPFDAEALRMAGFAEIQRIIREVDPPKPSTRISALGRDSDTVAHKRSTDVRALVLQLRRDLDWIVMKCLEKNRTRRYDTADAITLDIRRYIANEPVSARPPNLVYRTTKLFLRHRVPVTSGLAIVLAALIFASLSFSQSLRLRKERDATELARRQEMQARRVADEQRRLAQDNATKAESETAKATAMTKFLQRMLSSVNPGQAKGREVTVREVLDEASERVTAELQGLPQVEGEIRFTIAETYSALGFYQKAVPHIERNLDLWRESRGENASGTIGYLLWLADAVFDDSASQAEPLYRRALDYANQMEKDDPLRETLITRATGSLGNSLRALDRPSEAETFLRQALALVLKLHGPDGVEMTWAQYNLARALRDQGRFAEAAPLYLQAANGRRRLLGPEHQFTVCVLNELGWAYRDEGLLERAEPVQREALNGCRKSLGEQHPECLQIQESLAWTLMVRKEYEEAITLQRGVLAVRRELYVGDHQAIAEAANNLAVTLGENGQYAEAWEHHREAFEMRRRLFGPVHLMVGESIANQARLAELQRSWEKAAVLHREALALYRSLAGENHRLTTIKIQALAKVLAQLTRYGEAEKVLQEWAMALREQSGRDDSDYLYAIAFLGFSQNEWGFFEAAESNLRECLNARERLLLPGDWRIAYTRSMLGESMWGQHRFADSEALLLSGARELEGAIEVPQVRREESIERLVKLYEAWDAAEPGNGYAGKAARWRARLLEQLDSASR